MRHKTYFYIVFIVFALVALGHLLRVLFDLDLMVGFADIPAWVSWLAVLVIGYLSYMGFKLASSSQD